ncbi:PrsW family glutamic-type intramembrane protease [Irregularibacter muris]|uniref:Protease PrsW n=1 Tax=Irregularibacter muris TaxID=1796619 RepID=A0AAE3L338_9FIRM|nr:PrsW family glutamic-type intramembrane protease [Irregularibacter muris]MCR1897588.1 PrsW family glutamic-type intramembrane protease [Irregularibacter muris]
MELRLLIIAVAPIIAIGLGVYLRDRYDREPLSLLMKTFILGALSIIPTLFVEKFLISINRLPGIWGTLFLSFVVAGLTEEFFKRWVVLKSAFYSRAFNEKLDGIVYSVFAALGFAAVENVMYVMFRFPTDPIVGIYRGIFSVPAHTLFAVTMGYYLSLAKFSNNARVARRNLSMSLWMPVIFHGIFDFILLSKIPLLMLLFIPFVLYLWVINLRKLNKYTAESKRDYEEKEDRNQN